MAEGAAAAVAGDNSLRAHLGRHLGDQVDGELRVHLLGPLGEPDQAVVTLLKRLPGEARSSEVWTMSAY